MALETLIGPAEGLLGNAPMDLRLRVTRRTGESRTVGIRASKCTIGASPKCTLRIEDPAAQAVECLILHGAARSVVRRFSTGTTLNGRQFTDAPLEPGDTLSMGDCAIEVLPAEADLGKELAKTRQDIAHLRDGLTDIQQLLHEERAAFRERDGQLRARLAASESGAARQAETLTALSKLEAEFGALQRAFGEEQAIFRQREQPLQARLAEYERQAVKHAETAALAGRLQADVAAAERILAQDSAFEHRHLDGYGHGIFSLS